jgi:hypothetical protein
VDKFLEFSPKNGRNLWRIFLCGNVFTIELGRFCVFKTGSGDLTVLVELNHGSGQAVCLKGCQIESLYNIPQHFSKNKKTYPAMRTKNIDARAVQEIFYYWKINL